MATASTRETNQPTMHVSIALPVEKSRACLTAITIASSPQIDVINEIIPPINGIKLNIFNTPGELEKPKQRSSSPKLATPWKIFVPIKYVMKDHINHENKALITPIIIHRTPSPLKSSPIPIPIPEQMLVMATTKSACLVAP